MNLRLVEKSALQRGRGSAPSDPYADDPGFNRSWWAESAYPSPLWFYVVQDSGNPFDEVARVLLVPNSNLGLGYRGWRVPSGGSTEIDRLEVRTGLQHRGYGTAILKLLIDQFPAPLVAMPTDAHAAAFWRTVGWEVHVHPEGTARRPPLFSYPPSQPRHV